MRFDRPGEGARCHGDPTWRRIAASTGAVEQDSRRGRTFRVRHRPIDLPPVRFDLNQVTIRAPGKRIAGPGAVSGANDDRAGNGKALRNELSSARSVAN